MSLPHFFLHSVLILKRSPELSKDSYFKTIGYINPAVVRLFVLASILISLSQMNLRFLSTVHVFFNYVQFSMGTICFLVISPFTDRSNMKTEC